MQYSYPNISVTEEDVTIIREILSSGWVSIGKYMERLEDRIREIHKVPYVVACSNATTGLIIALKAAGIRNKKVALPAFTWPSTLYALECNNNQPLFVDIDKNNWSMDCSNIPKEAEAIIGVDVFGSQCPKIESSLPVVYDAAHGFGLSSVGHRGIAEVISLSFTKITTAMEGGAILTSDPKIADIAKELRRLSGRLGEINAYVALKSIDLYLSETKEKRQQIINKYRDNLVSLHYPTLGLEFQHFTETNNSVYAVKFPSSATRNTVYAALLKEDIETKIYYDPLVSGLENTDNLFSRILALPVRTDLPISYVDSICNIVINSMKTMYTPGKRYLDGIYVQTYLRREV